MEESEITKEQFENYVRVQMMGQTNMYDLPRVMQLSRLNEQTIRAIMKNYDSLDGKYPEIVKKWS